MAENGTENAGSENETASGGRKPASLPLIVALAAGYSIRDAARLAGVSERTVTRRLADPDFGQHVAEARAEMLAGALGRLAYGATAAGRTLRKLLKAKSENVRLGAARAILELGPQLRKSIELEERVAALERQAKDVNRPRPSKGAA